MSRSGERIDDSDLESETSVGYHGKVKRRKLESEEEECGVRVSKEAANGKRKNPIMLMPTEVLQNILKYLPYHELSKKVRLVNRRFRVVAESLLNIGFKTIQKKIQMLLQATDVSIGYTQDDMEIKCISRLLSLIETINIQYFTLHATIWRFVYNEFYRCNKTCMYGGIIIDTYETFFWKFFHCPNQLYGPAIVKDYQYPLEVKRIVDMTKSFCLHFEKVSEETIPHPCIFGGSKVVDILDCAKYCDRLIRFEMTSQDSFFGEYSYYFKNSWFIAMPVEASKEADDPHRQRMMHMRLRRIVLAHNEMFSQLSAAFMYLRILKEYRNIQFRTLQKRTSFIENGFLPSLRLYHVRRNISVWYSDESPRLAYQDTSLIANEQEQYERERCLRHSPNTPIKRPGNNVYTGYGDVEETFFFYGVMNEGAYASKFLNDIDLEDHDIEVFGNENENDDNVEIQSDDGALYSIPFLGIKVDVTVQVPISLAPLRYLESLSQEEQRRVKTLTVGSRGKGNVQIEFECPGAEYARVPTTYRHVQRRGVCSRKM